MDFNDTPEEAAFRAEARAWLEQNAETGEGPGGEIEAEGAAAIAAAKAWQAKKADAGWACITWPEEYGGRAATPIQSVIWNQEESRFWTPPNIFTIGHGMAAPTIMTYGTDAQKTRYLNKMLRGEEVWCQLFSEPAAGSDLAALRTRAERKGDTWVVNGQKIWTSGAHYSDFGILVTRHDPDVPKHAGLTYFVVDMKSPGIEIRPIKQVTGASNFSEVFFTNVEVPDENRLGEVGDGWRVAITTLMHERVAVGGGDGIGFSDLLELARKVRIGGRPASENAAVRERLADFLVKTRGLRYASYRTLTALSRGQTPGPEGSIIKVVAARMRQEMASFAIDLQGGLGSVLDKRVAPQEGEWQETYLGAPGGRIAGGTDEILRNIIAERVLRLPPEPRVDKTVAFRDIPTGSGG